MNDFDHYQTRLLNSLPIIYKAALFIFDDIIWWLHRAQHDAPFYLLIPDFIKIDDRITLKQVDTGVSVYGLEDALKKMEITDYFINPNRENILILHSFESVLQFKFEYPKYNSYKVE